MLHLFTGTDREKVLSKMREAIERQAKKSVRTVRITDANTIADLQAVLQGEGMFGEKRIIVLENTLENDEMRELLLASLGRISDSDEIFYIFEEKPDAVVRRVLEKYAESQIRFDFPKKERDTNIFSLASALKRADRKALWIGLARQFAKGEAPEAVHGVLFWGAKDMVLKSKEGSYERRRAERLVAELASLPHESRRNNFPLDYALEKFALSS